MQFTSTYKQYKLPDFYQGPQFSYTRESHPDNKKYIRYGDIQTEKAKKRNRNKENQWSDQEQDIFMKFDFKQEKKVGNKFWKGGVPDSRKYQNKKTVLQTK